LATQAGPIDAEEAEGIYHRLPATLQAATLHPRYVIADALRDSALEPCFWHFEHAGEVLLHGFHLSNIPGTEWRDLQSPYGYGGPLATTSDRDFLSRADKAFLEWAQEHRVIAEFLRFHPMLENWAYYLGDHFRDRETVWVDCTVPDRIMSYEVRQRTAIRKAIKDGVLVRQLSNEELLAGFPPFYREAMKAIQADRFYLFPDTYFEALFSLPLVSGLAAYMGDEIVAMSLFLRDTIGEYHLSAKNLKGARHSASSLIMHEAFDGMHASGIDKVYLGGGTSNKPDDPLFFFKAGFSDRRAEFRIGKRVIMPAAYDELKSIYAQRYADNPQRILFYRS